MTQTQLQSILKACSRESLRIPEEKKQAILKNPLLKDTLDILEARTAARRGTPILETPFSNFVLFETTGDRSAYEGGEDGYFTRRTRLTCAALSFWLYGREEDRQELENIIWAICNEYTWCLPAHLMNHGLTHLEHKLYTTDLFSCETADALAEICFLMEDRLHPLVVERARYLCRERVILPYLNHGAYWEDWTTNWAAVCAGAIGRAAIYLSEDDEELGRILWKLQKPFHYYQQGFSEDGACLEGTGYWTYGYGFFVCYADLLKRYTGGKIDMMQMGNMRAVASFQQKCYFNYGCTVNFSDAHPGSRYVFGLACYLASLFPEVKIPPLASLDPAPCDGCGRWTYALRNLLWAEPRVEQAPPAPFYALEKAQWYLATSRDGEISLAAKGGHNLEAHNQNDVGSFHLYKNGQMIIADLGAGTYSRQYFYDHRYSFLCCCSRGHAVPVVGGKYQQEGREYAARDVQIDARGIRMDIAPAYGLEQLEMLRREILFDHETGRVTVKGASRFREQGEEIRERLILFEAPEIREGEIIIARDGVQARVLYDPAGFVPAVSRDVFQSKKKDTPVYLLDLIRRDVKKEDQWLFEICP